MSRRSRSIRTDSWSPWRRALSSALSLLSCRFLLLRSRTSSRHLEFYRGGESFRDSASRRFSDSASRVLGLTSLCSRSSSSLLLSCSLSISSSFLLTEEEAGVHLYGCRRYLLPPRTRAAVKQQEQHLDPYSHLFLATSSSRYWTSCCRTPSRS